MNPRPQKPAVNSRDPMMYLGVARKHLRLIALLLCAMLLAGVTWRIPAQPSYRAKALVRLDYPDQKVNLDKHAHDEPARTLARNLVGVENTMRTAKALGISADQKTVMQKYVFKQTAAIDADGNLELEARLSSPELARRWPEELVNQYKAFRDKEHTRCRQAILDKYIPQLQAVRAKMEEEASQTGKSGASVLPWERAYEAMQKELAGFDYNEGKSWVYLDYQSLIELQDSP
jgi:hypothetical protein